MESGVDSQQQQVDKNGEDGHHKQRHAQGSGHCSSTAFHFSSSTSNGHSLAPHQQQQHGFGTGQPAGPQMGSTEAMQAFANLGLFHQQFPVPTPSGGGGGGHGLPPQLAAAAAAAGYGQRLMSAQMAGQNGSLGRKMQNGMPGQPASCSAPPASSSSSSSINRSQRCGVCRGCQCKPCGQCTYCQDSPQFGGPGVKKQSCIERRCLRVLENRLQRDAPTFKARIGCNACEDCRSPDCQICLVCLDRRFFHSKYMAGALCAKKRCNNATALELPVTAEQRSALKRHSECGAAAQQLAKRQILLPGATGTPPGGAQQLNSNIARILSAASGEGQQKFGGQAASFGRASNGAALASQQEMMTQSGGPLVVSQLGRPFWPGPPSQMLLPGQYHFDAQMASLAAVAVGFPQHPGMHYPSPYQPKLLSAYPKYEYFTADEGAAAQMANGQTAPDSTGIGSDGQLLGGPQSNTGTAERDLLVPPSYSSDLHKVVLQPL